MSVTATFSDKWRLRPYGPSTGLEVASNTPQNARSILAKSRGTDLVAQATKTNVMVYFLKDLLEALKTTDPKKDNTASNFANNSSIFAIDIPNTTLLCFLANGKQLALFSDMLYLYNLEVDSSEIAITRALKIETGNVTDLKSFSTKQGFVFATEDATYTFTDHLEKISDENVFAINEKDELMFPSMIKLIPDGKPIRIGFTGPNTLQVVTDPSTDSEELPYAEYIITESECLEMDGCPAISEDFFLTWNQNSVPDFPEPGMQTSLISSSQSTDLTIYDGESYYQPSDESQVLPMTANDEDFSAIGSFVVLNTGIDVAEPLKGVEHSDTMPLWCLVSQEGRILALFVANADAASRNEPLPEQAALDVPSITSTGRYNVNEILASSTETVDNDETKVESDDVASKPSAEVVGENESKPQAPETATEATQETQTAEENSVIEKDTSDPKEVSSPAPDNVIVSQWGKPDTEASAPEGTSSLNDEVVSSNTTSTDASSKDENNGYEHTSSDSLIAESNPTEGEVEKSDLNLSGTSTNNNNDDNDVTSLNSDVEDVVDLVGSTNIDVNSAASEAADVVPQEDVESHSVTETADDAPNEPVESFEVIDNVEEPVQHQADHSLNGSSDTSGVLQDDRELKMKMDKLEAERAQLDKILALEEELRVKRLENEKLQTERIQAEKAEKERLERAEQERLETLRREEQLLAEKEERKRKEEEIAEAARLASLRASTTWVGDYPNRFVELEDACVMSGTQDGDGKAESEVLEDIACDVNVIFQVVDQNLHYLEHMDDNLNFERHKSNTQTIQDLNEKAIKLNEDITSALSKLKVLAESTQKTAQDVYTLADINKQLSKESDVESLKNKPLPIAYMSLKCQIDSKLNKFRSLISRIKENNLIDYLHTNENKDLFASVLVAIDTIDSRLVSFKESRKRSTNQEESVKIASNATLGGTDKLSEIKYDNHVAFVSRLLVGLQSEDSSDVIRPLNI